MNFETVERCGRVYVAKNGVESTEFAEKAPAGAWHLYRAIFYGGAHSLDEATAKIASHMDTWYTVAQAAAVLVEMGAFDDPPSTQRVSGWARAGLLPGSLKIQGPGGRGGGGAWRISAQALWEFVERRMRE